MSKQLGAVKGEGGVMCGTRILPQSNRRLLFQKLLPLGGEITAYEVPVCVSLQQDLIVKSSRSASPLMRARRSSA